MPLSDPRFDPYHAWLSIPPKDQPPDHYRLLGLDLFEPVADVIQRAADRQRTYLRQHQSGPHAKESQQLLNEVSQAALCLLHPVDKERYDAQLRSRIDARTVAIAPPVVSPPASVLISADPVTAPNVLTLERTRPSAPADAALIALPLRTAPLRRGRRNPSLLAIIGGAITAPVVLLLIYLSLQPAKRTPVVEKPTRPIHVAPIVEPRPSPIPAASEEPAPAPQDEATLPIESPMLPTKSTDSLAPGGVLAKGEMLVSDNGLYQLEFQGDGNLVLKRREGWAVRWASHTNGRAAACALQNDGNLVLSDAAGRPVWASNTPLRPGAELIVQNDGNVVIHLNKQPLWSTNTRER